MSRNPIGCAEKDSVRRMDVSCRDRPAAMADQRGDRRFCVTEISRYRRERVAKHVRRDVMRHIAEVHDAFPKSGEPGQRSVTPRCGNTSSRSRSPASRIAITGLASGRIDAPVFVSPRRAVRRARSSSDHLSDSTSPRRHPVRARARIASTAGCQICCSIALDRAVPTSAYSASVRRRCRLPSAKRVTPCTGLSTRRPCRTA